MAPRDTAPRLAVVVIALSLGALFAAACSKHDPSEDAPDADAVIDVPIVDAARTWDAGAADATDAQPAVDAKATQEELALEDAGRFCGAKDQPDCPLQGWMKRNASTMMGFGDISSIATVFDEIALLVPPTTTPSGQLLYARWASIANDGAAAARAGNLTAAKAACRGCHQHYRITYHGDLRATPLPPAFSAPVATP